MPKMKTPNEIAKLQKKHKNNVNERNRLLEAEKMIPFKKRRVRFGQDGFNEETAPNVNLRNITPDPPTPPFERTPSPEVVAPGLPESSSPEQDDESGEDTKKGEFCVRISKADQQKAQDLWCEYQWNKLHPGKPMRLLKYIALERFEPGPEYFSTEESTSEVETTAPKKAPKRPVRRVHFS